MTALWHEVSHKHTSDPTRIHIGLLCLCLQPWNPLIWWQFLRLREAIERDCDRRVVKSGAVSVATYSTVLLDIAGKSRPTPLTAVALKPTRTQLGRRVVAMTDYTRPPRFKLAATLGTAAIGLLVVACDTQEPLAPEPQSAAADVESVDSPGIDRARMFGR